MVEEKEEMLRKVKPSIESSPKILNGNNACATYQFIASQIPLSRPCFWIVELDPLTTSPLTAGGTGDTGGRRDSSWFCCACLSLLSSWVEASSTGRPALLTLSKFRWHHVGDSSVGFASTAAGSFPVNPSGTWTSTFLVMLNESFWCSSGRHSIITSWADTGLVYCSQVPACSIRELLCHPVGPCHSLSMGSGEQKAVF